MASHASELHLQEGHFQGLQEDSGIFAGSPTLSRCLGMSKPSQGGTFLPMFRTVFWRQEGGGASSQPRVEALLSRSLGLAESTQTQGVNTARYHLVETQPAWGQLHTQPLLPSETWSSRSR